MPTVLRPDYGEPPSPDGCDWGFFSGSHCGHVGFYHFGGESDFIVCQKHWVQLIDIHLHIPDFPRRFYLGC